MSEAEIHAVNAELMAAVAEGRPEAAAALYTEDAHLLPPGGDVLTGREAVADFYRRARNDGVTELVLDSQELEIEGDSAIELGGYRLLAGGEELDAGRYLVVWKRQGARWRLYRDAIVTAKT